MMKRALLVALLALTGCERRTDMFGSNYDACLLQNATRGGDTDSRAIATDICKRHFERPWRSDKPANVRVVTTLMRDVEQYDGTRADQIKLEVWNNERATTVRTMKADITFYKDVHDLLKGPGTPFQWPSFDIEVGPDGYNSMMLTLGEKAPSPHFVANVVPVVVIPHGNPRR